MAGNRNVKMVIKMAKIMARRKVAAWPHRGARGGVAHARESQWPVEDKGHPGKFHGEKWFHPRLGKLGGWHKELPENERKEILERLVHRDGYATVIRRLNALRNVSTDRETDHAAKTDMEHLRSKFK